MIKLAVFVLVASLSFSIGLSPALAANSGSGLKVYVNLYHGTSGSAKACIYSSIENLGCRSVNLSQYRSPVKWGPWQFGPGGVAVGESFTVCITNLANGQQKCKEGFNSPAKQPEYLSIVVPGQTTGVSSANSKGINYLKLCKAFDLFIAEPCNTLTSADGYQLTKEGNRVAACFAGGAIAIAAGRLDLLALGPALNCGGSSDSSPIDVASALKVLTGK